MPEKSDLIAHNEKQNLLIYRIWQNLLKLLQDARHVWETVSLNWLQFILQWFIRFVEFGELLFHLRTTPMLLTSNDSEFRLFLHRGDRMFRRRRWWSCRGWFWRWRCRPPDHALSCPQHPPQTGTEPDGINLNQINQMNFYMYTWQLKSINISKFVCQRINTADRLWTNKLDSSSK